MNPTVVKQRLRLAAVSPKLLDIYAEDGMTLEQLMAFTVTADHARQEQVWDSVSRSYNKESYLIRRQLTEGAVRASDRRALFIGIEAYETAGGVVMGHCYHHALSSVKKWGGAAEDYLPIHQWFDESKAITADFRHRALRHHAEGIFMAERFFGTTITISTGRVVPVRLIGEEHVREDQG